MNTPEAPAQAHAWKPAIGAFAAAPALPTVRPVLHRFGRLPVDLPLAAMCFAASGIMALGAAAVQTAMDQGTYVPGRPMLWFFHVLSPTLLGLAVTAGLSARNSRLAQFLAWSLVAAVALPGILDAWRLPAPDGLVIKLVVAAGMLAGSLALWRSGNTSSESTAA